MYTNVSDEFKNIVKSNAIIGTARLTIVETNTILDSDVLVDLTITDNCYNNGQLIGTAMSKELEANLINKNNYDLADKELKCEIGVVLSDGTKEFVPYGNYIVKSYEDLKSNNQYKLIAYDYMDKLNIKYKPMTNITYPTTLKNFYYKLCTNYGISYETQTLPNESFKVNEAPNFDGMTARSVLMKCAELFGRFAKINRNNKMQMFLKNTTTEKIDGYSMNSKLTMNNKYGPVNVVSLELGNVEGENVTKQDDTSIKANGETIIRIADNPFTYSEDLREKAITDLFNALNGFTYIPVEFKYKSRMYLDNGDTFQVENVQDGSMVDSIVLNQVIKIPSVRSGEIKSEALTSTAIKQKYISQSKQAQTNTEILVDKINQKVTSIVSEIGDRSEKTTTITADIDGLYSKVEDVEDLTNKIEGIQEITLENCYSGDLVELHIYGNNSVFDGLMPNNSLVPSDTLVPYGDSTIIVKDKDGNSKEYDFGELYVLKQNVETSDEFVIKNNKAYIIRRIDPDGTTSVNEKIEELGDYSIALSEGTNTIRIKNYEAKIQAKWVVKSTFTDIYATKAEMNSSITQTAKEINSEVRKKVDENEIISKINQSAEKISIEANKININGVVSANGNFEIDKEGNVSLAGNIYMTGTNTKIVGGDGLITNLQFKEDSFVGFEYGAGGSVIRTGIACCVDIPEKFTIIEAKLTVQHSTLKSHEYVSEVTTYYGNCKNISCTKSNSIEYEALGASSIIYQPVIPSYKGEEVSDIGSFSGSQTKEFTITDKLSTGIQYLILADYVDNPSNYDDMFNLTGHITAFVNVTGYMKIQ